MIRLFSRRERKVIILGMEALIVAIVTYGALVSSGTFENKSYNLGGSIVGFLAALAGLNKVYGQREEDFSPKETKGAHFLSVETLKILDLRDRIEVAEKDRHTEPRSSVVEIDQHQMRKLTDAERISFHFATTGYGVEGENLSFPGNYKWEETTFNDVRVGQDKHLKKRYELTIDVKNIQKGANFSIKNRLTFMNAFQGTSREWFHTHIDFPTAALAIVLLFPRSKPCMSVGGLVQHSGRKGFDRVNDTQPTLVRGGDLVYWSVRKPEKGAAYQIEWTW